MKYSVPGHGAVQEVDTICSQIETYVRKKEFFSPLGLIRNLLQVNIARPFRVIQLRENDFKEYSKQFDYSNIPVTKVTSIQFTQVLYEIKYSTSHQEKGFPLKGSIRKGEVRNPNTLNQKRILRDLYGM